MKRATTFELVLPAREPQTPAYRWLYRALRKAILDGALAPGTRLPATRDVAAQYRLSRGTIVNAFELLKSEGYVEGSIGSGTFVSSRLAESTLEPAPRQSARPRPPVRFVSEFARRVRRFDGLEVRPSRAFRPNMPALDLFPATIWATIASRRLRSLDADLLTGCGPLGYLPLREAIAGYLATSRGVNCSPERIAIVSGVQEALDLAARLFLNPGDRVCMESPGYLGAAIAFESAGAKLSEARIDADGMIPAKTALRNARLIYTTPGHQFPLGVTMSLTRRLLLLDTAHRAGALVFEDDYDSEFRYGSHPVPALQSLDRTDSVLFAGTFSKVLFPALRLGYLVVPADLVPYVAAAKSATTRHAPVADQAILCDFIADGHFARHLRKMRDVYAERLDALLDESRRRLSGMVEVNGIEAGLQTVGWLRHITAERAVACAAAAGVELQPLTDSTRGRVPGEGLLLGFSAVDAKLIRQGVRALARALEPLHRAKRSLSQRENGPSR